MTSVRRRLGKKSKRRVKLSLKILAVKKRKISCINLLLLFLPSHFIYEGQQVPLGESTHQEWRLEVDEGQQVPLGESTLQEWRLEVDRISRNTPVKILNFRAILHVYRWSLEDLYHFLTLACMPKRCVFVEFYFTFLFTHLTTLTIVDYFREIPYIKTISSL